MERKEWNAELVKALIQVGHEPYEAEKLALDSSWDEFYEEGYTPLDAAWIDISYAND